MGRFQRVGVPTPFVGKPCAAFVGAGFPAPMACIGELRPAFCGVRPHFLSNSISLSEVSPFLRCLPTINTRPRSARLLKRDAAHRSFRLFLNFRFAIAASAPKRKRKSLLHRLLEFHQILWIESIRLAESQRPVSKAPAESPPSDCATAAAIPLAAQTTSLLFPDGRASPAPRYSWPHLSAQSRCAAELRAFPNR